MENHPTMESFEKFIQQQADEFRMYPTKRVWYSIYNNIHPGRKWPSISMCIVLLSALLMIGYLNTKTNKLTTDQNISGQFTNKPLVEITTIAYTPATTTNNHLKQISSKEENKNAVVVEKIITKSGQKIITTDKFSETNNTQSSISSSTKSIKNSPAELLLSKQLLVVEEIKPQSSITVEKMLNTQVASVSNYDARNILTTNTYNTENNTSIALERAISNPQKLLVNPAIAEVDIFTNSFIDEQLAKAATIVTGKTAINIADRQWIENYALYNRPAPRKWKGKLSWQAHFTPSVIYRSLKNNTYGKPISGNLFATNINNSSVDNAVNQTPSIGLEAGVGLQYPVFKGLRINAGLQFNYTRFNIGAYGNAHPSTTSLAMNTESSGQVYELSRSTPYSNIAGLKPTTLHNQTYQVSLPVGASLKLAGTDNLEWYAGATIQPTFVIAGNSYLISTDRRKYVHENSMLNHFNLNAGFETFISFKTAAGITWQIGPQYRKQLFSTNSKLYSVEERLMGYGIKIGISKKL